MTTEYRQPDETAVHNVQMGDIVGNDDKLHRTLDAMSAVIENDAAKHSRFQLVKLLRWYKSLPEGISAVASKTVEVLRVDSNAFSCLRCSRFLRKQKQSVSS